jgi:hypothetical protein
MNDTELDRLIATAASVSDAAVKSWDLAGPEADLRERIMAAPSATPARHPAGSGNLGEPGEVLPVIAPPRRLRRRRTVAVGVVAAAALAIVAVATLGTRIGAGRDSVNASDQTPAPDGAGAGITDDLAAAQGVPRLASVADGWHIVEFDEPGVTETLSDGTSTLDVDWSTDFDDGPPVLLGVEMTVAGEPAVRYNFGASDCTLNHSCEYGDGRTPGPTDIGFTYVTLLTVGDIEVRIRGEFPDDAAVDRALAGLVIVPAAEWLALLPDSAVLPSERRATVDEMLTGIPLPPGFDPAPLKSASTIRSRYQVGVQVTGSVTCGWLDSWTAGRATGDAPAVQAAVDAMATSPTWPILTEMEGGWPDVLWGIAAALPANAPTSDGLGKPVSETWRGSLECGRFD